MLVSTVKVKLDFLAWSIFLCCLATFQSWLVRGTLQMDWTTSGRRYFQMSFVIFYKITSTLITIADINIIGFWQFPKKNYQINRSLTFYCFSNLDEISYNGYVICWCRSHYSNIRSRFGNWWSFIKSYKKWHLKVADSTSCPVHSQVVPTACLSRLQCCYAA